MVIFCPPSVCVCPTSLQVSCVSPWVICLWGNCIDKHRPTNPQRCRKPGVLERVVVRTVVENVTESLSPVPLHLCPLCLSIANKGKREFSQNCRGFQHIWKSGFEFTGAKALDSIQSSRSSWHQRAMAPRATWGHVRLQCSHMTAVHFSGQDWDLQTGRYWLRVYPYPLPISFFLLKIHFLLSI